MAEEKNLKVMAAKIRKDVLRMTYEKKAGFIGTSFSCADILAALYGKVMQYDPKDPEKAGSDVFLLSKGHGASAWYAALAEAGVIDRERLFSEFNTSGYSMGVHPKRGSLPGVIASSGSLGQGAGLACGIAASRKIKKESGHVFVLIGDGEINEGSNWEAFMFAKRYQLDNLTVILDRNRLQSYGHDEEVLNLGEMKPRFESFGFTTREVNGHEPDEVAEALFELCREKNKPTALICSTIKGKGFAEFEDKVLWHYKWPEKEHYEAALAELNRQEEEALS